MIEIKDCLPHADAKRHFIDLRSIRLESERREFGERRAESIARLAAQGIRRSGHQELEVWQFKEEMHDALAMGYAEDAIATCKMYGIPLTRQFCACLLEAVGDLLVAQYKAALQTHAHGIDGVKIPLYVRAQRAGAFPGNRFPIMKHIRVMVEDARVKDEKERLAMTAPKANPGDTYTFNQNITQHGGVMNASQTGDVSTQQLAVGELVSLRPALAEMRTFFKAQENSLDADESVGLLASAEKAVAEGNENKAVTILKQVPEKAWDIGKAVIPQVLLVFMKAHGIISS